jgi:hypothetical protein
MTDLLYIVWTSLASTVLDVIPILAVLLGFQFLVILKPLPNWKTTAIGCGYVLLGLSLFLVGLEMALFPLGESMAAQLTDPRLIGIPEGRTGAWDAYGWVYAFAFCIGFATTVAEPSLIAVALKAEQVSGGTVRAFPLRVAVALGVAVGVSIGCFRIVTGTPLPWYIGVGYVVVIVQTYFASKKIVPLAYDSGGVTTSTVTVPVVAALGLGLASTIPGRNPVIDGFGLIAFASLFPMMTVMAYAKLGELVAARAARRANREDSATPTPTEEVLS